MLDEVGRDSIQFHRGQLTASSAGHIPNVLRTRSRNGDPGLPGRFLHQETTAVGPSDHQVRVFDRFSGAVKFSHVTFHSRLGRQGRLHIE